MLNVQHQESFSMRHVLYQVQNLCCIKLRDLCCIKSKTYVVLSSGSLCRIKLRHCVVSSLIHERFMYSDLVSYQDWDLVLYQGRNLMLYQCRSLVLYQDWSCVVSIPYSLCCIKLWLVSNQVMRIYYVMYV